MRMIKKIPDNIVSMISAGEVIQSPQAVIKECIENSIDAKSTEIKIIIKRKENIIIIKDNGIGINKKDLKYLTKRHYTSKFNINNNQDSNNKTVEALYNLNTLGFRGEALYSISLLSNIKIKTKYLDSKLGIEVLFKGEELIKESMTPIPMNKSGTIIIIKDLFYNIKTKLVFNIKQIFNLINSFKLFYLKIDFKLIIDDKIIIKGWSEPYLTNDTLRIKLQKSIIADSYLMKNIKDLYSFNNKYFSFIFNNSITSKTILKNNFYSFNNIFICFINKRLVSFNKLNERIKEIYLNKIKIKKSFIFYIEIFIDLNKVDINIHPSKLEVLLEDEDIFIEEIISIFNKLLLEVDSCEFIVKEINNKISKTINIKKVYNTPFIKQLNFLQSNNNNNNDDLIINYIKSRKEWNIIKPNRKIINFKSLLDIKNDYNLNYNNNIKYKLNNLIYIGVDNNKLLFQYESSLISLDFKGVLYKFMLSYFLNEFSNYHSIYYNEVSFNININNTPLFLSLINEYFKLNIKIINNKLKILEIPICHFLKIENNSSICFFNYFTLSNELILEFINKLLLIKMTNEKDVFLKILNLLVEYFSIQIINEITLFKENISLIKYFEILNPEILQKSSVENYLIFRISKLKPTLNFDEYFQYITDLKELYNNFGR